VVQHPSHLVDAEMLLAVAAGELKVGARVFTQHVGRRDVAQSSPKGETAPDVSLA
jgi:hypothetical protein